MFSWRTYLLRLCTLCIFLCAFILFTFSTTAFAKQDPITITSQTDTLNFPKSIDFHMSAHDDSASITSATIDVEIDTVTRDASIKERHNITPDSSSNATFSWHDDLTQSAFPTPGSTVRYYWVITDSQGNSHTDSIQNFDIIDTRFNWQQLSQDNFKIAWYNRPANFGQVLLTEVNNNIKHITDTLGLTVLRPITIWVYENEQDFHGSLSPDIHEWTGGIAYTAINQTSIVVESSTAQELKRDMPHELTHLVFHQNVSTHVTPLWFDEGLAVYNQIYHEPDMQLAFQDALDKHSLLQLDQIVHDFPNNGDQAYLAYAQSWKLIDYMYTNFGKAKMAALIQLMGQFKPFDTALQQTIALNSARLENQWRLSLNQPALNLAPNQIDSAETPGQLPRPSLTDRNAPTQILLGTLLIIIPMLGFSGLLTYQRITHKRVRVMQQASRTTSNTILPSSYGSASTPVEYSSYIGLDNYTSPATYSSKKQSEI